MDRFNARSRLEVIFIGSTASLITYKKDVCIIWYRDMFQDDAHNDPHAPRSDTSSSITDADACTCSGDQGAAAVVVDSMYETF